jgi:hypothetical protein
VAATGYGPQIGVLGPNEHPLLALTPSESRAYRFGLDNVSYRITDEASTTSDEDDGLWEFNRHERGNGMMRSNAGGDSLLSSAFRIMICARISKTGGAFSPISFALSPNSLPPRRAAQFAFECVRWVFRPTCPRHRHDMKQTVLRKRDRGDSDDRSEKENRI